MLIFSTFAAFREGLQGDFLGFSSVGCPPGLIIEIYISCGLEALDIGMAGRSLTVNIKRGNSLIFPRVRENTRVSCSHGDYTQR